MSSSGVVPPGAPSGPPSRGKSVRRLADTEAILHTPPEESAARARLSLPEVAPLLHSTNATLLAPAKLAGQAVLRTQRDERLVDLVRAGNEAAFEAVVARYRGPLLRYAGRLLPGERAEDVVQQTFVRAYDAMLAGDAELRLRPWLYRIAHNTALNALRDRGLRFEELSESLDGVERPEQAFERRSGLAETIAAVQGLPERQREAIVLRELEGRSYEEIAGEMGVTAGAVRQLLNRARSALRAGASSITPAGLIARIPWTAPPEGVGARVAELCGGAGGGALVAKLCATALVTGTVVGGVAYLPGAHRGSGDGGASAPPVSLGEVRGGSDIGAGPTGFGRSSSGALDWRALGDDSGSRSGPGDGSSDRSGQGGRGPGSGDDSGEGSGSGELRTGDDAAGSSGRGSSEPSEPSEGFDLGGSGSGGSGTSGSGTSGSGSSGSGLSGSGSSGSGLSGSGSSEIETSEIETSEIET